MKILYHVISSTLHDFTMVCIYCVYFQREEQTILIELN